MSRGDNGNNGFQCPECENIILKEPKSFLNSVYYVNRYFSIEREFMELKEYIPLQREFVDGPSNPNDSFLYKFGSAKLMDLSYKICSEVETQFRILLERPEIQVPKKEIKNQCMDSYREFLEPIFDFSKYKLSIPELSAPGSDVTITPFLGFDKGINPWWFKEYSPGKHYTVEYFDKWTLKHTLYSLGGLILLILNHPDAIFSPEYPFHEKDDLETKVFYGKGVKKRFQGYRASFEKKIADLMETEYANLWNPPKKKT